MRRRRDTGCPWKIWWKVEHAPYCCFFGFCRAPTFRRSCPGLRTLFPLLPNLLSHSTFLSTGPPISRFSPSFNIYSWRAEQSHWDSLGRHSSEANFLKVLYFCFQGNALLPSPRAEPVKPPPSLQRFYKQKCFGRQLSPLGAEQARAPSQKNCQGWLNLLQWSDPPWAQARATPCSRPVAAQLNETHQLRLKPSDRTAPAPTAHCDQHKLQLK